MLGQHLEDDHRPLVRDATDQLVDQGLNPRIVIDGWWRLGNTARLAKRGVAERQLWHEITLLLVSIDILGAFFPLERSRLNACLQAGGADFMKTNGNTILITGGGSGIGEALAHRFHDAGNTVIVAGRRRDALERAIAGRENMHAIELDVESAGGITDFTQRLLAEYPGVNVLINNAGIMRFEMLDRARDLADAE